MDIPVLAAQLTTFLAPFLPYLLLAGEKAAEEAGKKIGGALWENAKALWKHLQGKEKVQAAAEATAKLPDNPAIRQGLEDEIVRALKADPRLAQVIAETVKNEVVQRVIATGGSHIEEVAQEAGESPTTQEVRAEEKSVIKGVRQTRQ